MSILSVNCSHLCIIYVEIYEKILSGGLEVSLSIALTVVNSQSGQKLAFSYVTSEIIGKNVQARAMVFVHDTSSECALQMYEVSLIYL